MILDIYIPFIKFKRNCPTSFSVCWYFCNMISFWLSPKDRHSSRELESGFTQYDILNIMKFCIWVNGRKVSTKFSPSTKLNQWIDTDDIPIFLSACLR